MIFPPKKDAIKQFVLSEALFLPPELRANVTAVPFIRVEQRTQCRNSRTDPMLTISAPRRSSVKILLVASPKAFFLHTDLVPVRSACGVCLSCHSSAAVKTMLNSGWLSQRGQVQLCVYDPLGVRVKFYYVCLCACGAKRQAPARMCRWNRWSVETRLTSDVDQLKLVVS